MKKGEPTKAAPDDRDGERVLWVSVILQAIRDATDCLADKANRDVTRTQARAWFRPSNPDFIEVCNLAGMDPSQVAIRAKQAIKRYDETRSVLPPVSFTHRGVTCSLREWSERTGIPFDTIYRRYRAGCSPEHILSLTKLRKEDAQGNRPRPATRTARLFTIEGVSKTAEEWAGERGLKLATVNFRLRQGLTIEEALQPLHTTGRKPEVHTVDGVSKTLAEWAEHLGIKTPALHHRIRATGSLAAAIAKGRRGQGANFSPSIGTGGGSTAQDSAQIDFPQEAP